MKKVDKRPTDTLATASHMARWKHRCKGMLLPAAASLILLVIIAAFLLSPEPAVLHASIVLLTAIAWIATWSAGCGWPFFASLEAIYKKEITLTDEHNEATTYRGAGAIAWGIAGVVTCCLVYLLAMAVPLGLLLDWAGTLG